MKCIQAAYNVIEPNSRSDYEKFPASIESFPVFVHYLLRTDSSAEPLKEGPDSNFKIAEGGHQWII